MRNDSTPNCFPCQELPLRCFISSKDQDKRIGCTPDGVIFSTANRKAWEEWKIVEVPDGMIRLQNCAHGKYLISDINGHTSASSKPPKDQSRWKLMKQPSHDVSLYSFCTNVGSRRKLSCSEKGDINTMSDDGGNLVDDAKMLWDIELLSGELCFMSSQEQDRRLSCHPWSGKLSMSTNWKGWEVWRFIDAGNNGHVRISNWTHSDKFLCSDENGNVWTTDNHLGSWELWDVERAPLGFDGVTIKSVSHGRFLKAAIDGSPVATSSEFSGTSTTWQTEAGHRQTFYISSLCEDKRLGSSKKDVYVTHNKMAWEEWELKQRSDGFISLFSKAHKKHLGSNSTGRLYVTENLGESELWNLEKFVEGESVYAELKSVKHGRYLCCQKEGDSLTLSTIWLSNNAPFSTTMAWSLEPCMPDTISGDKMRNLAIGGSVALVSTVAAPFAVLGAITGLGFGAGGIATGSIAAGWMSAEAVASGGLIAAGGTVATLQSIGAAGLGMAGTSAALGAGAAIGASAVGISAAVPSSSEGQYSDAAVKSCGAIQHSEKRPFCNWRYW